MYIKATIVVVFLSLLFVKVSAVHVYAHQNTDYQVEICGYCDLAIENQQSELTPAHTTPELSATHSELPVTEIAQAVEVVISIHHSSYIFTRPPPMAG